MNLLAALFIEAGLSIHAQVPEAANHGFTYWKWQVNEVQNPYGHVVLGFDHEFSRKFSARVFVRHESSVPVQDWGTDSAGVAVTWRPFR